MDYPFRNPEHSRDKVLQHLYNIMLSSVSDTTRMEAAKIYLNHTYDQVPSDDTEPSITPVATAEVAPAETYAPPIRPIKYEESEGL